MNAGAQAFATQIGEGFAGSGPDAAHINTVLGARGGPIETAWASALAQPSAGHIPFVVVVRPGLAVKPLTVFVNKATVTSDRHGTLTWGAAQAGVARGVGEAVAQQVVDPALVDELLLITAVWVNPAAEDERAVYDNNATATFDALTAGRSRAPSIASVLAEYRDPSNPYFANKQA